MIARLVVVLLIVLLGIRFLGWLLPDRSAP